MDLLPPKWELAVEVLHTNGWDLAGAPHKRSQAPRCRLLTGARHGGAPHPGSRISPHQRSSKNGPRPPAHDPASVSMSQMYRATPQSILDWARDQLGLGASQLGRVEGFHRVLGSFSAGCWAKCPPLELL
ncbi:hypothetical protein DVH24_013261 [Malus domestica]|uniref:Uncharacterized protein n=1 Tax=Malus domestica TaxID=3750 RepID=A0A498HLV9_MALDO|nr:hypothetical protein DVH24_013261 [Malus domestica]